MNRLAAQHSKMVPATAPAQSEVLRCEVERENFKLEVLATPFALQ